MTLTIQLPNRRDGSRDGHNTALLPLAEGPCPSCTASSTSLTGGLGKHQESVTGLRQRGTRDNLSCCSFGAWQLGAANAEAGF